MPQMTPPPQPVAPAANAAMRGFAGIPSAPATPPPLTKEAVEADLAAQVARINAEAMAEEQPAPPPEPVSGGGGIFARLSRKAKRAAPPPAEPGLGNGMLPDASMGDAAMADAAMDEAGIDASMGDASMGDAGMGDVDMGIDPALAAQAFGEEEKPAVGAPVTLQRVVGVDVVDEIDATGQLLAKERATIAAEVGGRITEILIDEGGAAAQGAAVLSIDPERRTHGNSPQPRVIDPAALSRHERRQWRDRNAADKTTDKQASLPQSAAQHGTEKSAEATKHRRRDEQPEPVHKVSP